MNREQFMEELEEAKKMHLVERMTQTPPNCMVCGKGNTPDEAGEIGPFLDLERDVNWDDSTYLCKNCGTAIGAIFGMQTEDDALGYRREIRRLRRDLHEAKAERRQKVTAS